MERSGQQGVRGRLRAALGLKAVHRRLDALERRLEQGLERLETQLHESREEAWDRSRERWRSTRPTPNLTWDVSLDGDAFIERAAAHGAFGPDRAIVEIGPGYGRLLRSALSSGADFSAWTGVDLSAENVSYLTRELGDGRVTFVQEDVESFRARERVDTVISSLTFKHLFPSFERALANLRENLAPAGLVIFDLIEGERRYFEEDGVTYIRWYSRPEIEEIAARAGLEVVAFDEVRHLPTLSRLLVVARRPD